ncbi:MAG: flagellar basal body rod protein FlgB [Clostridia bacterium]|jgi:flagellar basal-body rod protein FlgB|nr:flagellar basal body rod protein FlgB [Clostridia bacterium]
MLNLDNMFRSDEKALDVAAMRNKVINQNIANVNTPGYKRSEVKFEEYLQAAGKNISDVDASVEKDLSIVEGRIDGNNVVIDKEMAELAKNTIRYNAMIRQVSSKMERIKSVLR